MNWITVVYATMAAFAALLGGIYLVAWFLQKDEWSYLLFVVLTSSIIGVAGGELAALTARTPDEYAAALRWWHVPIWSGICAFVGLVYLRLRPRQAWLGWSALALRTASLVANFGSGQNLNYLALTGIEHTTLLGEQVAIATGVPNPWMLMGQASNILLALFVIDGGISAWRRGEGERSLALVLGLLLPISLGATQAILAFWGFARIPVVITPLLFFIAAAMAFELSFGLLRAARAERDVQLKEAALALSEQRLTLAAEAANAGFWYVDTRSGEVWATAKTQELFGLSPIDDLRLADFLKRVHPRDRVHLEHSIETAARSDETYRAEFRVVQPDGSVRWLAGLGRTLNSADPGSTTLTGVTVDITERKAMLDKTRRQHVRLERLSKTETLSELSASLAHELNQPLAMILTNAEAARALLSRDSPNLSELQDILTDIISADRRAAEVIRRLRGLLERGEPEREDLSLNKAIERVAQLVGSDVEDHGVSLNLNLAATLPLIRGDGILIEQAVLNLITNACDAVAGNRPHDRRVSIVTLGRADNVLVEVADNGCGSPDPTRMFDAFYTTKPGGLGLGLAIVRSIVTSHAGRIWAESAAGRGTTVYISLPINGGES